MPATVHDLSVLVRHRRRIATLVEMGEKLVVTTPRHGCPDECSGGQADAVQAFTVQSPKIFAASYLFAGMQQRLTPTRACRSTTTLSHRWEIGACGTFTGLPQ